MSVQRGCALPDRARSRSDSLADAFAPATQRGLMDIPMMDLHPALYDNRFLLYINTRCMVPQDQGLLGLRGIAGLL